jgi:hypothetical protein
MSECTTYPQNFVSIKIVRVLVLRSSEKLRIASGMKLEVGFCLIFCSLSL